MKYRCIVVYKVIKTGSILQHKPLFPRSQRTGILQYLYFRTIPDLAIILSYLGCQRECNEMKWTVLEEYVD